MMLILTYHQVARAGEAGAEEFYAVSPEQLARHLELLKSDGWSPMEPSTLRRGATTGDREFLLTFDDGTSDHYNTVFPLLRGRGLRAVFFVPTSKLNNPGRLTGEQVLALAQAGHVIGNHSHDHQRVDALDDDGLRERFGRSQEILRSLTGERPWFFAPPGGFLNAHAREVAQGFGAEAIRTMRWGFNAPPDRLNLETVPLNRHTDDAAFLQVLSGRRRRALYFTKQVFKAVVPPRTYERVRRHLARWTGGD